MDYKEWVETYFKNQDLMRKKIRSIENKEGYLILHKDSDEIVYIIGDESLTEKIKDIIKNDTKSWIILKSSKEKIKEVIEIWEQLESKPNLSLIFVNLSTGSKWAINPSTHSKVCEVSEKGLLSLHNNS